MSGKEKRDSSAFTGKGHQGIQRASRADPRKHGHGKLCPGRETGGGKGNLRVGVPRRRKGAREERSHTENLRKEYTEGTLRQRHIRHGRKGRNTGRRSPGSLQGRFRGGGSCPRCGPRPESGPSPASCSHERVTDRSPGSPSPADEQQGNQQQKREESAAGEHPPPPEEDRVSINTVSISWSRSRFGNV